MPDVVGTDSGLEIKILHHCTLSIQYYKVHKNIHLMACDNAHQTQLTYVIGCVNAVWNLSKFTIWRFVCRELNCIWRWAGGRSLGHEGGALMSVTSALVKGTPRAFHPLLCKDTARRQLAMNQESDPHQTLKLPAPWPWTSWPPELPDVNFCLSHSAYAIFVTTSWMD